MTLKKLIFSALFIMGVLLLSFSNTLANKSNAFTDELTTPVNLRCNYRINPLGIEDLNPVFSWQINTTKTNWLQSGYQIFVSTSPKLLTEKKCDVWNSGKILGGESVCIPYEGPKVDSQMRYYWRVKVWDENGNPSSWSEPAYWEMGILNHNEWSAKWIARIDNNTMSDRENIRWVWLPDQDALNVSENTVASFQVKFKLHELPLVASMQTVARGNYQLFVNGVFVDGKDKSWQVFERQDIPAYLRIGENTVEVKVSSAKNSSFNQETGRALNGNYAAFGGRLEIEGKDGNRKYYPTSEGVWMARNAQGDHWEPAKVAGKLSDPRFGLDPGPLSVPVSYFRKEFKLKKAVESVRLYVSALGSYRMFVNGERVGEDALTPEFTNYKKRITYQTYDVSNLLKKGKNAVGGLLGDGWYGSPLGWNGEYDLFGNSPNMLLAELHVWYKDGTIEKIVTDETWKTHRSPILKSEIYSGEFYDARLEQKNWNKVGFQDDSWSFASDLKKDHQLLIAQKDDPVKVIQIVKPLEIRKVDGKKWLIDMGQNLAGRARLKVKGEAGTVVKMRFGEILSSGDSLYARNLRNATATNSYVLRGNGVEEFTPHFTFQGFRYVEISGYPGDLPDDAIVAEVISSVSNPTGSILTSSDMVNNMYSLGIWGQRSNFISVPTDCPQRDERLGYTGDGQVFWRTATYNFDVAAFTHKWMNDITDEQTADGGFTNTAPAVPKSNRKNGAPGWEDAGVIVPWGSWMQYGDKSIIQENWDAMARYMDYVEVRSPGFIRPGSFLGDWLAPDFKTPNKLLSTGLWALTADMMAQMAAAIGKTDELKHYSALKGKIRAAFQKEFISPDGTIGSGSQTSYVIALHTGMVPDSLKKLACEKLIKAIEDRDWHLSTGFLGTPYLLFVLANNGMTDAAYRLLLNETYPSWGYMIKKGATTWWERWNSDSGDPSMNSFNHYAFGSVVEWLYRSMAGINADPDRPGFKKIIISPVFDRSGKINHAKGEYMSVYGKIESEWTIRPDKTVSLKVNIPANTTAKIKVPGDMYFEAVNGKKLTGSDRTSVEVGSGVYEFEVRTIITGL